MSPEPAADAAHVNDNTERHRYELELDGTVAGYVDYHDRGDRRSLIHTVVEPAFEGRGLGSTLARAALDDARSRNLAVLPHCPFIREYIARHRDDYLDLVPEAERATFGLD